MPTPTTLSPRPRGAVIGCGGMGRHHIHALATLPAVELVGISDIFAPNLARGGDEVNLPEAKRFLDYRQLFDDARPEFVVVATQAPQHAEITIAAAEVGLALGIVLRVFRNRGTANVDEIDSLKW